MFEWWSALPLMKQFFLAVAIPSTVILVIQSIMTFAGMGGDHDMDGGGGDASGGHFDTGGGHFDVGNGHFDAADGHGDIAGHLHAGHAGSEFSHDGSHDVSGEHNQGMDGFRFFTIRGIVAFLSVFGWTGAALLGAVDPIAVFVISFLAGLTAMTLVGLAFWAILRLQASGNLDYTRSIGLQGEVYLTVPAGRSGVGKVNITLQETLVEVDAITDETEKLPTGSRIRVVGLEGNNVLLVSKEWEGHPHDT